MCVCMWTVTIAEVSTSVGTHTHPPLRFPFSVSHTTVLYTEVVCVTGHASTLLFTCDVRSRLHTQTTTHNHESTIAIGENKEEKKMKNHVEEQRKPTKKRKMVEEREREGLGRGGACGINLQWKKSAHTQTHTQPLTR